MPPPSETASQNTPLAPSVEKAYYRKCIQLKRRLNEVEGANEELKIRRVRLDRSIMKMRLERAFLLDELRKRMDQNIDGSEASEDERTASPPPDRPHRDKRRRHANPEPPAAQPQPPSNSTSHPPSHHPHRSPSDHASSRGQVAHTSNHSAPPHETSEDHSNPTLSGPSQHKESTPQYPPLGHGSPYGGAPTGRPGSSTAQTAQTNGTGEEEEGREGDDAVGGGGRGGGGGSFTAVNS
ncbi:hypothetical protein KC343_g7401 [Hortaea werneckii]|uniref:INO80 complex subunit F domain-containing protein n=1 Tax=Hortaea werneckii TaxID=91943 RepID=A0A3M7DYR4_HORWE|nr:hypothetical protein KC323_g7510 [Hortaea werneckii]KAI6859956.1 hypothetical protein KC338_g7147 [Hortaea werneckii]KAI7198701.1 hypothetical protein KC352_g20265 [Hortaea werneckii]KAI7562311.1 hypothetical protein KC317_g8493 [Hortaea werneckii]KAI7606493.1 hypothetical protein KC346_g10512 [Hortaea werneckii]